MFLSDYFCVSNGVGIDYFQIKSMSVDGEYESMEKESIEKQMIEQCCLRMFGFVDEFECDELINK